MKRKAEDDDHEQPPAKKQRQHYNATTFLSLGNDILIKIMLFLKTQELYNFFACHSTVYHAFLQAYKHSRESFILDMYNNEAGAFSNRVFPLFPPNAIASAIPSIVYTQYEFDLQFEIICKMHTIPIVQPIVNLCLDYGLVVAGGTLQ